MEYTAQWGPKGFIVSPTKFVSFDDFSAAFAVKSDNNTNTSGTSQSNTLSVEPQKIALATTYVRAAGVDPRAQIEEWKEQLGKYYPLYIGGERFGPQYLQLKKVDVSNLLVDNNGLFLQVTVTIALEEYTVVEKKTTSTTTTNTTGTTQEALSCGPVGGKSRSDTPITHDKISLMPVSDTGTGLKSNKNIIQVRFSVDIYDKDKGKYVTYYGVAYKDSTTGKYLGSKLDGNAAYWYTTPQDHSIYYGQRGYKEGV